MLQFKLWASERKAQGSICDKGDEMRPECEIRMTGSMAFVL
jgi:hypothetical protein